MFLDGGFWWYLMDCWQRIDRRYLFDLDESEVGLDVSVCALTCFEGWFG